MSTCYEQETNRISLEIIRRWTHLLYVGREIDVTFPNVFHKLLPRDKTLLNALERLLTKQDYPACSLGSSSAISESSRLLLLRVCGKNDLCVLAPETRQSGAIVRFSDMDDLTLEIRGAKIAKTSRDFFIL